MKTAVVSAKALQQLLVMRLLVLIFYNNYYKCMNLKAGMYKLV